MDVSIMICTRNRAASLQATLEAIKRLPAPSGLKAELIVVDNGSSDDTADVVQAMRMTNFPVRYVYEPTPGLSHARNRGLREAAGEIFLFTDDDVRPPRNWIDAMCRPIRAGEADAVAGGVGIPEHLQRDWLKGFLLIWLAGTPDLKEGPVTRLVGANMAFHRRVLDAVPRFDSSLGAGASGAGEETLFGWRLLQHGYRMVGLPDVQVEHHFGQDRLEGKTLEHVARSMGRSNAYLACKCPEHLRPQGSLNLWRARRLAWSICRGLRAWCTDKPSPRYLYALYMTTFLHSHKRLAGKAGRRGIAL
ncbi:MAG: glycosyltransferase family A protein [Phycisphaeraceae bacterium]